MMKTTTQFGLALATTALALSMTVSAQVRDTTIAADSTAAIIGGGQQLGALGSLETSFEEFTLGDINTQNGWSGQFGNWQITDTGPNTGAQHVESVSDGLGQTLMFAPDVGVGSNPVSSMLISARLTGTGVTWDFIPQSPTAALVVTRIAIQPDDTVSVLDAVANDFVPTGFTMPQGEYVEFGLEVDRTTFAFEVFADGVSIFSGTGFAGDIEQFVGLSLMETTGSTLDIDDLSIIDGPLPTALPESVPVPVNNTAALMLLLVLMAGLGAVAVRRFA